MHLRQNGTEFFCFMISMINIIYSVRLKSYDLKYMRGYWFTYTESNDQEVLLSIYPTICEFHYNKLRLEG